MRDKLVEEIRSALEECRKKNREWANAKPVIANTIAKYIAEHYPSTQKIYLVDLSGGEANNTLEGGYDIDLYIETSNPREAAEIKKIEMLIDNILQEALRRAGHKCVEDRKHNLVEFHVNSEFVKPLIKSKYSYKVKLYEA